MDGRKTIVVALPVNYGEFERVKQRFPGGEEHEGCLLYTSDAADERSSVDLGGRRIIKKKNRAQTA